VTSLGGESVISAAAGSLTECSGASISERELTAKLAAQASTLPGRYSISVRELSGERHQVSLGGGERKEPASVIKIFAAFAVLARVDDGRLSLSTRTRSGITVDECLRTMIHISDNYCHADLLALIGNSEINRHLYLAGWPNTFYVGYDGTGGYQSAKKASTDDVAEFLERLERGRMLSPASTALLLGLLDEQLWRSKIPSGIPSGVSFGNKTGQLWISTGLVEGDAAIVRAPSGTYSIAVLGDRNAANWAIARLSRTVYEHLSGSGISPTSWGEVNLVTKVTTNLRNGPGGAIVGTAPAGTRLIADVSNRVWYRVKLNGAWHWVHHTTVATRY
jgi:beta-lactamase class A